MHYRNVHPKPLANARHIADPLKPRMRNDARRILLNCHRDLLLAVRVVPDRQHNRLRPRTDLLRYDSIHLQQPCDLLRPRPGVSDQSRGAADRQRNCCDRRVGEFQDGRS